MSASIPAAFQARARSCPGHAAVVTADRSWTLGELDHGSEAVAGFLAGKGIRTGNRVALYCVNSAEFAMAYLGILRSGAVVVPLNLLLNPKELAFILDDSGALWISWPKRTSRVATDVTEDVVRAQALPLGFVDVKVCSVSETWSALKLVVRTELRGRGSRPRPLR